MTSFSAPVAQLDRALPSEGRGHKFESCRARQISMTYQMASCTIDARRGTRKQRARGNWAFDGGKGSRAPDNRGSRCRLVFNLRLSDSSDAAVPAGGKKESDATCHVRLDLSA